MEEEVSLFAEQPRLKTLFIHKKNMPVLQRKPSSVSSLQNSSFNNSSMVVERLPSNFVDAIPKMSQVPWPSSKK